RMHHLEKSGDKRAGIVNLLMARRDRLIGGLLLGNNLVNILASALATGALVGYFGDAGVAYATLIMTALVLVFAEVLPKTYAFSQPDHVSLRVAKPVRLAVAVFAPLTAAVQTLVRGVLRLLGAEPKPGEDLLSAHDELRGAIDLHHREGAVVRDDRDMLGGILDLKDLEVSDIMVHRTNIVSINAGETPEKIVSEVLSSPFTRVPLWRDSPENIIGVLHAKDLARAITEAEGKLSELKIAELATDPWFVPEATSLQDQLNAFLKRKSHFALVVDEYGEVMGLVTLEDILEEIVGEITDEHDAAVAGVRPQADGTVTVDGSVPIRDLNRAMDWELPDEEATTIAGLVIHEARMIPEQGQAFTFHGFRFEVLRRQRNRISLLRIGPVRGKAQAAARDDAAKPSADTAASQDAAERR
ncbi:MAG TPA: HlyC/CorC family transporter, partial [Hyphomicrobiales bacterium]|nr:HlyC/CorC family transporter [Hyphomicrobiales bacterium]